MAGPIIFNEETGEYTRDGRVLSMTPNQIRIRARRAARRLRDEVEHLYKPIEEWDDDELARGKPRNANGDFRGPIPLWLTPEMCEKAKARYKQMVKDGLSEKAIGALQTLQLIMDNKETDDKGKPLVSASVKLDAAKFVVEHLLGKPTQTVEGDISVKLQALLGSAMVNPDGQGAYGYLDQKEDEGEEDDE